MEAHSNWNALSDEALLVSDQQKLASHKIQAEMMVKYTIELGT